MAKNTTSMGFRCSEDLKRVLEIISALEATTTTEFIVNCLQDRVKNYLDTHPKVVELIKEKGIEI